MLELRLSASCLVLNFFFFGSFFLNPSSQKKRKNSFLIDVLATLSKTPYTMRPLRVGVYILPHKMEKLQSKGVFEVPYRHDIQLHFVDLSRPLEEQGPFDILVHKLASWYVAARTEPEVNRQLKECFQLIKSCQTNLDFERYPYSFDLEKNNELDVLNETNNCIKETSKSKSKSENDTERVIVVEDSNASINTNTNTNTNSNKICEISSLSPSPARHRMYVLDHPFAAFRTTDRWHIYNTLRSANLEYESKEDKGLSITFSSPRSLLFTSQELTDFQQSFQKQLHNCDKSNTTTNGNNNNNDKIIIIIIIITMITTIIKTIQLIKNF
ncbi:hypothetical protein RFI_27272 [Reticulomyxa filosa]|uniref:Inositol-tetrakisphosphate 1-kinase N-terminal domain-containing protein n=1 Tax=Reticulomyxa filosa TaxID=46433 RepID=X6MAN8_RETFI|nr:hypothetical protein RFI_27272 [Reticulomyxa filosa]|eukprot:ETO10105.1 hypothetical protein RFI_27272 [Reticulomyxa filosa]